VKKHWHKNRVVKHSLTLIKTTRHVQNTLTALLLLSSMTIIPTPVQAIPGDSHSTIQQWRKEQTFFPLGSTQTRESSAAFLKTLTDNRELVYTIVMNQKGSVWEEIKVISTAVNDVDTCRYLFAKDYVDHHSDDQDRELCYQNIGLSFRDKSSKLIETIQHTNSVKHSNTHHALLSS
jgi:hypothetical protein